MNEFKNCSFSENSPSQVQKSTKVGNSGTIILTKQEKEQVSKGHKNQSAIDTVLNWDYHPSKIEAKVDKKPFTNHEKELIEKCKF